MAKFMQFPEGFVWGASTAAYQIEGATEEGGRGDCIWDAYARIPGKTMNGESGSLGIDHYHRYKEDVQLMKQMGLKSYRFSIAWARIIPAGIGEVNEEGVAFYNNLINELLTNGIEPMATLFHGDLPLRLEMEFDGWLGGKHVQDAFVHYARVCFERFGDRVKTWLTINEPWIMSFLGYGVGVAAPGRSHNKHYEPYVAGHNFLLAHAKAVDVYRREFKATQDGKISITLSCDWYEPKPTEDPVEQKQNAEAAERAMLFCLGWTADPIYLGDYPQLMKDRCGDRLPKFTDKEKALLKGSADYFSLNHYITQYASTTKEWLAGKPPPFDSTGGLLADQSVELTSNESWKRTDLGWPVVPWGFEKLLLWIQSRYSPTGGIYVTENGCAWAGETKEESVNDDFRVDFYQRFIASMHRAIEKGADVRGYYAWSFADNYEWSAGYSKRFGLHYVDYETMERTPKKSALWYTSMIPKNGFEIDCTP